MGSIGEPSLRAAIDEEASTVELLRQLDEIHLDRAMVAGRIGIENALLTPVNEKQEDGTMTRGTVTPAARYEKVFCAAGIGSPGDDPVRVAARVRASPVREALVAAMDDWAACASHPDQQKWIDLVLKNADPDPWRNRVRDPTNWRNGDALQELADEAPVNQQPPQILVLLSARLRAANRDARPLMTRVVLAYPTDFWANAEMGDAVFVDDKSALEAMGYFRTAMVIRPQLAIIHDAVGVMYERCGRSLESLDYHQQAIRLEPGEAVFHSNYAWALVKLRRYNESIAEAKEAIRLDPGYDVPHQILSYAYVPDNFDEALKEARTFVRLARPQFLARAYTHLRGLFLSRGRYSEARDVWREALANDPPDHDARFGYAELCLLIGDEDAYRLERAKLLRSFGDSTDPTICERTAKACLLLDGDPAELKAAATLADRAAAAPRTSSDKPSPYDLFAQGLAAYRLGRFDQAITLMTGKAATVTPPCPKLITAMALYKKGDVEKSRNILNEAVRSFDWNQHMDQNSREEFWVACVLRREAESLVLAKPTSSPIGK
jgi:serine/threonine-protein kinase